MLLESESLETRQAESRRGIGASKQRMAATVYTFRR